MILDVPPAAGPITHGASGGPFVISMDLRLAEYPHGVYGWER
jgi:hypothetical protein